jgi:predicted DNA-binding transcriptional regulator AlpA
MGRKRKNDPVSADIRLAAFEKQCEMIADAVKLINSNYNELLSADEVAKMCGMSRSAFLRLADAGRTPASIKLERLRRWKRQEILAWIAAGCPVFGLWNKGGDSNATK